MFVNLNFLMIIPNVTGYNYFDCYIDPPKETSDDKESIDTKIGPILTRLWAYSCNVTKGKKVNCMAWNKANQV